MAILHHPTNIVYRKCYRKKRNYELCNKQLKNINNGVIIKDVAMIRHESFFEYVQMHPQKIYISIFRQIVHLFQVYHTIVCRIYFV